MLMLPPRNNGFGHLFACLLLTGLTWPLAGCAESVDPQIEQLRNQYLLNSVPTGDTSISKVLKSLTESEDTTEVDVVIKGRIDAGDSTAWADGLAAFVLTDASGHDGETDHNPHTCPFCSRNIKDYLAKISFVNDNDQLIEVDSRKLFDVREKQLVYVTGTGTVDQDGLLNVVATGLYIPE